MTPVVEALVILPFVAKSVVIVPTVVEEVLRTVLPDTVSAVADALTREVLPVTLSVEERVRAVADAVVRYA